MQNLKDLLGKKILFFDGAMGTELYKRGLPVGELPALWNFTHPEDVLSVHSAYLQAGANLIKTNSFCADALSLQNSGYQAEQVITRAVELAHTACRDFANAYVCLDISPLSCGKELNFAAMQKKFAKQIVAGIKAGIDAVLLESMWNIQEIKAGVAAAKEICSVPIFVTMALNKDDCLQNGVNVVMATQILQSLGINALGFNCGYGVEQVIRLIDQIRKNTNLPIIANPNAGLPEKKYDIFIYPTDADCFAELMQQVVASGVWLVGGCCGTTPEYIAKLKKKCQNL